MKAEIPLHIDSTMMNCFRNCHQKWWLEFGRGLRPPGLSIDLHAGACFASALESVYKHIYIDGKEFGDALLMAQAKFFTDWGNFEIPEWKRTAKTSDRVWEAVEQYFKRWSPKTDPVQPYMTADGKPTLEYTFAIPLEPVDDFNDGSNFPAHPSGAPFIYVGRFDMLGLLEGRPCIRDEKTTGGSIGRDWARHWNLRSQFIGYTWACQQCGIPNLETVVVRGIAIQKTQIVLEEAIKIYTSYLVSKWHEQLRRDLWKLSRCYSEGYFDYDLGEACTQYGNCQFLDACGSPNPEPWLADFEVRHWNPLNKNPVEGTKS